MALGIQTESGSSNHKPVVKFNAKAGRVYRVDRSQDGAGTWQTDEVEITDGFTFVPDFEKSIEVGWMLFAAGQAPDFRMVKIGEAMGPKPGEKYKQGFRLLLKLGANCGGDIREMAGTAKALLAPIDKLHSAYEADKAANPGKLPVVKMNGSKTIVTQTPEGKTSSYEPIFEIVKWIDRPADFDAAPEAKAEPAVKAAPPPKPEPARELADTEF